VVELQAAPWLRFTDLSGRSIEAIAVVPGETVVFRVTNTAGFEQNFWVGTDDELRVFDGATEIGIPTWRSGVRELRWTVPDDVASLRFGCTVPGHYAAGMQGSFSTVASVPDGPAGRFRYDDTLFVPDPTRIEVPEHGFAITVPGDWPEWGRGQVGFTLMPLRMLDGSSGTSDWLVDEIARDSSMDPELVQAWVEAGQASGSALLGAWWSEPPTEAHVLPDGMWSVHVVPWEGATLEQIRSQWVESESSSERARDTGLIQLPSGAALLVHEDGPDAYQTSTYYLTDGASVLMFMASSSDPPDDRWLSFAETLEFLPQEDQSTRTPASSGRSSNGDESTSIGLASGGSASPLPPRPCALR
jgi:hypothetical protein